MTSFDKKAAKVLAADRFCAYCGRPAEGNFSVHRDGFDLGPEVDLCDACGDAKGPTLDVIWGCIRQAVYVRTIEEANELLRQGIDLDIVITHPNERGETPMGYRDSSKPKPMTSSDLEAEIASMQRDWDTAYADFKKKVDPLELREQKLVQDAVDGDAVDGGLDEPEDRLGWYEWTCDKCDETDEGSKSDPPVGWQKVVLTDPVELTLTLCLSCIMEKR